MRFPRFHFGIAITLGLTMLCMSAVPVFADGHAFVPTPDASYVYVTNYSDNTVSVIDPQTNEVVDTIAVGSNPDAIAVSKTGTGVYVANYSDGTVSVIDRTTNTVDKVITVGTSPAGIAITPDDREAYVSNSDDASVSVISLATGTVTHTITVGSIPLGVAISPNGQYVYVTNGGDNTVSMIGTSAKTQLTVILNAAFNYPISVTFSPDGASAYVTNDSNSTVVIINTATHTVANTIDTGNNRQDGVAFLPNTVKLYVTSLGHSKVFFDNLNTGVTGSITGIGGADGIAFLRDGTYGYVAAFDSAQVAAFDPASDSLTNLIAVGTHPTSVAIWEKPTNASSSPSSSALTQTTGGHRGNSTQLIIHALEQRIAASSTSHAASPSNAPQESMSATLKIRTCDRVMKWFKNDSKMLERVNARLEKRFGFTCGI